MTTTMNGRRVLVVGASSGIGAAVAAAARAAGADVAISARRAERLHELRDRIEGLVYLTVKSAAFHRCLEIHYIATVRGRPAEVGQALEPE